MPRLRPFVKGCLTNIFCLIIIGVIIWIHFLILSGEDLSDVDFGEDIKSPPRDILFRANEVINSGRPFECSERALNQYLGASILGKEINSIAKYIRFERVAVRLRDGEFDKTTGEISLWTPELSKIGYKRIVGESNQ